LRDSRLRVGEGLDDQYKLKATQSVEEELPTLERGNEKVQSELLAPSHSSQMKSRAISAGWSGRVDCAAAVYTQLPLRST
jgi:hypothetical protein